MFKTAIGVTPFTNSGANDFFGERIYGDSFVGDNTFLATLRALIYPRMKEDEKIVLRFTSSSYSARIIEENDPKTCFENICPQFYKTEWGSWQDGIINIHYFDRSDANANEEWIKFVEWEFINEHKDWYRIDKVTDFYRKVFNVVCFVHPTTRAVALFCDKLDYRTLHYLQCGILAFMPWYFDQESGVTELEMELIESLRMKTPAKYEECLIKISAEYDFETERIRALLEGFELQYERAEIDRQKEMAEDYNRQIKSMTETIVSYIKAKTDIETKIMGLEERLRQGSSENEVMEFFLSNKRLFLDSVRGTRIKFVTKDFLENFDSEIAEGYINNDRSFLYNRGSASISNDDMKKLMTALFIDQELRIQFCAAYYVDLNNGGGDGIGQYSFDSRFNDAMPNPHIQQYTCTGDYRRQIIQACERHDAVLAIMASITSCKSLNWADGAVMSEFVSYIHGSRAKCIELPDGKMVTIKEAIAFLNEREEKENE